MRSRPRAHATITTTTTLCAPAIHGAVHPTEPTRLGVRLPRRHPPCHVSTRQPETMRCRCRLELHSHVGVADALGEAVLCDDADLLCECRAAHWAFALECDGRRASTVCRAAPPRMVDVRTRTRSCDAGAHDHRHGRAWTQDPKGGGIDAPRSADAVRPSQCALRGAAEGGRYCAYALPAHDGGSASGGRAALLDPAAGRGLYLPWRARRMVRGL